MRRVFVFAAIAALSAVARPASAQALPSQYNPFAAQDTSRLFLDLNLLGSTTSNTAERTFTTFSVLFGEVASSRTIYPRPGTTTRVPFDVGGGFRIRPGFEVGVSYARTRYEEVVRLGTTVPHPVFLNATATGQGVSGSSLERTESATNISVAIRPVRKLKVQVRLYGGPTFFSYGADMVREVQYTQTAGSTVPSNTIAIVGFASEHVSGRAIGAHGGLDVAYFFTRMIGITGGVRMTHGRATIDREPLSQLEQQITVGGVLAVMGVRFRLGG